MDINNSKIRTHHTYQELIIVVMIVDMDTALVIGMKMPVGIATAAMIGIITTARRPHTIEIGHPTRGVVVKGMVKRRISIKDHHQCYHHQCLERMSNDQGSRLLAAIAGTDDLLPLMRMILLVAVIVAQQGEIL